MSTDENISALFYAIVKWTGATRLDLLPGCWEGEVTIDGQPALVAINAHGEDKRSRDGFHIPPVHALVLINGWPAALVNPYGGTIMGGGAGIEDRLIAAFEAARPEA